MRAIAAALSALAFATAPTSGPARAAETCPIERALYELKDNENGYRTYITLQFDYAPPSASPNEISASIQEPTGRPGGTLHLDWDGDRLLDRKSNEHLLSFAVDFAWAPMPKRPGDAAPYAIIWPGHPESTPEIWTLFLCL